MLGCTIISTSVRAVDWQQRQWRLFFISIFFSVAKFSLRRSARIKKLIQQKLMGAPKTRPQWLPFQIFEVLIEGMSESKTYLAKVARIANNLRVDLFPNLICHFRLSGGEMLQAVQAVSQCPWPLVPLGWYFLACLLHRGKISLRMTIRVNISGGNATCFYFLYKKLKIFTVTLHKWHNKPRN